MLFVLPSLNPILRVKKQMSPSCSFKVRGGKWTEISQSHRNSLTHCASDKEQEQTRQTGQSVQTGIIAQVTYHNKLEGESIKRESSGAGKPEVAVLGQGRLTQSQPARSQPHCLVPCASHLNHCVVVNILQRPLDRSGLVHPATDDRA